MPGNAQDPEFIYDNNMFKKWVQECADILMKARGIESANITVKEVETLYTEYDIKLNAYFINKNGTEYGKESEVSISYLELLNIFGWDKDGCLDISFLRDKEQKEKLFKFLISRIWDWYKYYCKMLNV